MHDATLQGLGSGVSAKELILSGFGMSALAACTRRTRFALFLLIPTILIAGAANVLGWLTGAGDGAGSGQPVTDDLPTGQSAGSQHHSMWNGWLVGLTILLVAVLIGILVVTAMVRGRREDFVRGALDDLDGDALWGEIPEAFIPYPDEARPPATTGGPRGAKRDDTDDPHSVRMNVLAYDFLSHVCERGDRPALIDIRAPLTQHFLSAFTDATDLFLTEGTRDPRLRSAIREAERRWTQVKLRLGTCRGDDGDDGVGPDPG